MAAGFVAAAGADAGRWSHGSAAADPLLVAVPRRPLRGCFADRVRDRARLRDPEQLVFVPMLFLAPLPLVPLLVADGLRCSAASQRGLRARSAGTRCSDLAGTWFALGPVWALAAACAPATADRSSPSWIYALAFAPRSSSAPPPSTMHDYLDEGPATGVADALVLPRGRRPLSRRARARASGRRGAHHAGRSRPARLAALASSPRSARSATPPRSSSRAPTAAR